MKVGILSFPHSYSHGATLQLYALYKVVEKLGYDTEVVNYNNIYLKKRLFEEDSTKLKLKREAKRLLSGMIHIRRENGFRSFEKGMKHYPSVSISCPVQLKEISEHYDKIVCGSDQVWNPNITGYDLSYFLNFCMEDDKRVAYAPSFGVEQLTPEYAGKVAVELKKFHSLSVREQQGHTLIKQISGLNSEIVLDPTLLRTAEEWYVEETEVPEAKEEYIFYYTIHESISLRQFCNELSEKTGCRILAYGSNRLKKMIGKDPECMCDILPREWLYLIHHAKYIVTNSFHGTAFSINMRKNFYVEFSSKTNSRLENIVNTFCLQNRVIGGETMDGFMQNADYTATDKILLQEYEKSIDYLRRALYVR